MSVNIFFFPTGVCFLNELCHEDVDYFGTKLRQIKPKYPCNRMRIKYIIRGRYQVIF